MKVRGRREKPNDYARFHWSEKHYGAEKYPFDAILNA